METATDKTEVLLCPVTPFWELSDQLASEHIYERSLLSLYS